MTKTLKCLGILAAAIACSAFASPGLSEIATGSTAVSSSAQSAGYAYLTCSQDVHWAVGSTAVATSARLPAGRMQPIAVTEGQQISILGAGPGRCYLNRFDGNETDPVVTSLTADDISAQRLTAVDAGITRAQIAQLDGVNLSADSIDAGFYKITVVECTGCGAFTGGGVANATTFGSEVSAPKFDGGSYVGTTLNLSGAAVIGADLKADTGLSFLGNVQTDGGSKVCFGGTGSCDNYCRAYDGVNGQTVSGSLRCTPPGGFVVDTGGISTVNSSITSYYNVTVGSGAAGVLEQSSGSGRQNTGHCDTRATSTSYPQVCNQVSGKARIANGAGNGTPFSINNGLMLSAAGSCRAWFSSSNTVCTTISCAADAGNMTFVTNADCSGAADFDWALESRN